MNESIREGGITDYYFERTQKEINDLIREIREPIDSYNNGVRDLRSQAGLEILARTRSYVNNIRAGLPRKLPDVVTVKVGGAFLSADLNINKWTLLFAGADREVEPLDSGEFWFEHHQVIITAIKRAVWGSRGVSIAY